MKLSYMPIKGFRDQLQIVFIGKYMILPSIKLCKYKTTQHSLAGFVSSGDQRN